MQQWGGPALDSTILKDSNHIWLVAAQHFWTCDSLVTLLLTPLPRQEMRGSKLSWGGL